MNIGYLNKLQKQRLTDLKYLLKFIANIFKI